MSGRVPPIVNSNMYNASRQGGALTNVFTSTCNHSNQFTKLGYSRTSDLHHFYCVVISSSRNVLFFEVVRDTLCNCTSVYFGEGEREKSWDKYDEQS